MWCVQFLEAFVRDKQRELTEAVARPRRLTVAPRQGRTAENQARQCLDGEDRASADPSCCPPVAA